MKPMNNKIWMLMLVLLSLVVVVNQATANPKSQSWIDGLLAGKDMSHQNFDLAGTEFDWQSNQPMYQNPLVSFNRIESKALHEIAKVLARKQPVTDVHQKFIQQQLKGVQQSQTHLIAWLTRLRSVVASDDHKAKIDAIIDEGQSKLLAYQEAFKQPVGEWTAFKTKVISKLLPSVQNGQNSSAWRSGAILRNSSLPYHGKEFLPAPINTDNPIQPSYSDEFAGAGSSADLISDRVVSLTSEIYELANSLDHDYIKINNFVRQQITEQYYAGSMKGAAGTLATYSGNDVDQAALLMALLRASNIPSRFVSGVIELPVEDAVNGLGINNPNEVIDALNRAGIPNRPVIQGGQIVAVQKAYTWVSAYVPYAHYRGSANDLNEPHWIPLAPAIKQTTMSDPVFDYAALDLRADDIIDTYYHSANSLVSPMSYWQQQVENASGSLLQELLSEISDETNPYHVLPAALPFNVVAELNETSSLPLQQIHQVQLKLTDGSENISEVVIEMPELAGKRLSLSYLPATVDDLNLINQAGGMSRVPPYLVDLKPVFKIDGVSVEADASAIAMGKNHQMSITLVAPMGETTVFREVPAGTYLSILLGTQNDSIPLSSEADSLVTDETKPVRLMHNLAVHYHNQWSDAESIMASVMGLAVVRPMPSAVIVAPEFKILQHNGLPISMEFSGVSLDAMSRTVDVIAASDQMAYDWMRMSAHHGSWLESDVFAKQWHIQAISADQGISQQIQNQADVLHIDESNLQTSLGQLNHPVNVIDHITQYVSSGHLALVPVNQVSLNAWQGSTWQIWHPESGHAGYFISGGYAGGQTTETPEDWALNELNQLLSAPYAEGVNENPLAARNVHLIESTNNQTGVVGETLELPSTVLVTDGNGRAVVNASVTFSITDSGNTLMADEEESNSSLTIHTNDAGEASVDVRLKEEITSYVLALINADDTYESRVSTLNIKVSVASDQGPIFADTPLRHFIIPAEPDHLEIIDCYNYARECDLFSYFGTQAGVMHVRVVDQFGNFVSNVSVDINALPGIEHTDWGGSAFKSQKIINQQIKNTENNTTNNVLGVFGPNDWYETAKMALVEECVDDLPSLLAPNCALSQHAIKSKPAWETINVFTGAPEFATNNIWEFPIKFNSTGLEEQSASVYSRQQEPSTVLLYQDELLTGPYGNYITAEPGSQLNIPITLIEKAYNWDGGFNIQKFYDNDHAPSFNSRYEIIEEVISGTSSQVTEVNMAGFDVRRVQLGQDYERTRFKTTFQTIENPFYSFSFELYNFADTAGIELRNMSPALIRLNDEALLVEDLTFIAEIMPSEFRPLNIRADLYQDGEIIDSQLTLQPTSAIFESKISAGSQMDLTSIYEIEFVMNADSAYEVKSGKYDLSEFSVKLIESVNGSTAVNKYTNGKNGGLVYNGSIETPIIIQRELDIANEVICGNDGFYVNVANDSFVSIDLERLDVAGQPSGEIINLITNEAMNSGENYVAVKPEELGTHTYQMIMYAESQLTNDEEFVTGMLISQYDINNSLPIGHAIVKGVDLADGSMVYSKKDIALTSPGADLEFVRTYSSQARHNLTALGRGWSHNYLSRVIKGRCGQVTVTGADGGSARFMQNGDVYEPMKGYHSSLIYNQDGTFDFYPKGGNKYHYIQLQANVWWMQYIEDPNGNRLTVQLLPRESTPVIASVTDSVGRSLLFEYELKDFGLYNAEMLTQVKGPDGININFEYDDLGNLISANREGDSTQETLVYTEFTSGPSRSLLTTVTDNATQGSRSWGYRVKNTEVPSSMGDVPDIVSIEVESLSETDAGSTVFNYVSSAGYNSTATVNQNGQLSTYQLNPHGAADSITSPAGTKTFVWETQDDVLLTSETDENGRLRTFDYDEHGNVTEERLGTLVSNYTYYAPSSFDPPYIKNRIKTHTDWRGNITEYEYDLAGNKISETKDQISTGYTYDDKGLVKTITDGRSNITTINYDDYGQQISIKDPESNTVGSTWNARGQKLTEYDANQNTYFYTYDDSDRMLSKRLGAATWNYDYQLGGRIRIETDPNEHSTRYEYDTQGRLLEVINAEQDTFTYAYDLNGNKTMENDFGGHETTFEYDEANRLKTKTEPMGKVTSYTYDNVGNVRSETTADRVTEYEYDPNRYFQTSITRKSDGGDTQGAGPAVITRTVDGHGNVLTETDPNQNETTFTYDAYDRMLTQSGPLGSGASYTYDNNGNVLVEEVFNSTGNQVTTKEYDLANRLVQTILPNGGLIKQTYDGNGNITSEAKPNGYHATYNYDEFNRPTHKSINQQTWLMSYDLVGNLKTETWPNDNVVTYEYDKTNREISKTDSEGLLRSQTYDADSNVKTQTDGNGVTVSYEYNDLHQKTNETKPYDRGHTFTYNVFGDLLTDTGPTGQGMGTITHQVDHLGRRYDSSGPDDFHMVYGYDLNGNLTSQTDSRGIETIFVINALNQIESQTTGSFTITQTHDTLGNLLTQTDYRGIVSEYTYDKQNNQTSFTRAGQLQVTTTYNLAGLPVRITDARGKNTVHEYNSQYHKTRTLMPENQVVVFEPDAFGDVVFQDNPGPNDITRTYDLRRRLKTESNGANETTTYEYDLNNNRIAVIKPEQQRWEYDFDDANRLTHVRNVPESIETVYSYDAADNLTTITDAENKVTIFGYDNRNRKTSKTYPGENEVVGYGYDKNGNLDEITYPNGVTATFDYDNLNRQYQQNYTGTYGTASVTMTLDGNGNIEHVTETNEGQTHNYSMTYDDLDRMDSKTDRYGNTFFYDYDPNGNRKLFRDHDNNVTNYTYDDLNRLEKMSQFGLGEFRWNFNAAGLPNQLLYPNGSEANYEYDNANRISLIDNKQSGVTVTSHAYEYDKNGNRIKLTESNIDASQITTYEYDDADRLTKVFYPTHVTSYTLDKVGNRDMEVIDRTGVLTTRDYDYNERDQLTSITDTDGLDITYDYDAFGNQTEKTQNGILTTFDYTPRQRVKTITVGSGQPNQYEYDYAGQRVNAISASGTERRYLYDGLTLVAETNTIGNTLATYHYGTRHQLAETRNSQNAFYLADALGTTVAITNQDGSIQNRMDYDVWGNLNQESATSASPFGFTGYIKDEETDLYYANARYYDSFTGRFLREDPLNGDVNTPPSLHRYLYGYANPTYYVDPDGKLAEAGHEKVVKLVAMGFDLDAKRITDLGFGAQLPDESSNLDAMVLTRNALFFGDDERARRIKDLLHALKDHPEKFSYAPLVNQEGAMAEIELNRTIRAIMKVKHNDLATGFLFHRVGDLFAHRQIGNEAHLSGYDWGHAASFTTPDVIQRRPQLFDRYVQTLISIMGMIEGDNLTSDFKDISKNILFQTDQLKNLPEFYRVKQLNFISKYSLGYKIDEISVTKSNAVLQKDSNELGNKLLYQANQKRKELGKPLINLAYKPEEFGLWHYIGPSTSIQDVIDHAFKAALGDKETAWQYLYTEPQIQEALNLALEALESTPPLSLPEAIEANKALLIREGSDNEAKLVE